MVGDDTVMYSLSSSGWHVSISFCTPRSSCKENKNRRISIGRSIQECRMAVNHAVRRPIYFKLFLRVANRWTGSFCFENWFYLCTLVPSQGIFQHHRRRINERTNAQQQPYLPIAQAWRKEEQTFPLRISTSVPSVAKFSPRLHIFLPFHSFDRQ